MRSSEARESVGCVITQYETRIYDFQARTKLTLSDGRLRALFNVDAANVGLCRKLRPKGLFPFCTQVLVYCLIFPATVIWLNYCRCGVKHYTINQSINHFSLVKEETQVNKCSCWFPHETKKVFAWFSWPWASKPWRPCLGGLISTPNTLWHITGTLNWGIYIFVLVYPPPPPPKNIFFSFFFKIK